MQSTQKDGASEQGKETAKKPAGEVLSFYLTVINQCVDMVMKMGPVFMMGAGMMLWSYLREIGWAHLLLPTASSPSGLAFLAISALVFVGAAIFLFLTPSLFFSPGIDLYPNRKIPKRVPWILVFMAVLWLAYFAVLCLVDGFAETSSMGWFFIALYFIGVVAYAAPGLVAACRQWERQEAQGKSGETCEKCKERLWRTVLREHWLMTRREDDGSVEDTPLALKENVSESERKTTKEIPLLLAWVRPFVVVFMALLVVLGTSYPVIVLIRLWGEQLEFSLGTTLALVVILGCGGSSVLPAYAYLWTRSRNASAVIATKNASMAAMLLVLVSLLAMMYLPIRDKVFHALEIQSSQKEYFLISSPVAAQALGMLGFPLVAMPVSVADWNKKSLGTGPNAEKNSKNLPEQSVAGQSVASTPQNNGTPDSPAKPDTPVIAQAWVGYSFGDTVLLCRWRAGERAEKRDTPFHEGRVLNNVCLPLARSELRRLSNVWPAEKAAR